MQEQLKSFKDYCKEAKKRLKSGFWHEHYKRLDEELAKAKNNGISPSKIKEYYIDTTNIDIRTNKDKQEDYVYDQPSLEDLCVSDGPSCEPLNAR